jgi:electron transport complex protein RnfB
MSPILLSALTLGGVGLVFGTLIAMAHRRFYVWEDPRIDAVTDMLPAANCGACGFAGCRVFAENLVAGETQPATCTVMGEGDLSSVSEFLGVEAGAASKKVARLLCAGGTNVAIQMAQYYGIDTCGAAAAVAGGGKGCTWGCLGLSDCEVSCDFDAIYMDGNSLPHVIPDLCTACGDCVEACPKDLFVLQSSEEKLIVQCMSLLEGEEATELCEVACNACGRCALDAATGVVEMKNGLAVVNYELNETAGPEAIERCPTGAIAWVEGPQFAESSAERIMV